jgi:hypothetical protein
VGGGCNGKVTRIVSGMTCCRCLGRLLAIYMCPHTTTCVSAYYYMCVLILFQVFWQIAGAAMCLKTSCTTATRPYDILFRKASKQADVLRVD